jgi:hypothetical protein
MKSKGVASLEYAVICCAPVRLTWRWRSSTGPTGGTVSQTARVSIARRNLKKAAVKRWPDEQKRLKKTILLTTTPTNSLEYDLNG